MAFRRKIGRAHDHRIASLRSHSPCLVSSAYRMMRVVGDAVNHLVHFCFGTSEGSDNILFWRYLKKAGIKQIGRATAGDAEVTFSYDRAEVPKLLDGLESEFNCHFAFDRKADAWYLQAPSAAYEASSTGPSMACRFLRHLI